MRNLAKIGVSALVLASGSTYADFPYPCTNNRCSLMQIDAIACLGNGTTMNGWWGSACALGIGQYSCFSSPSWEQLLAIGGCSNINTVLPGFTSHPTSNHDWWHSSGNRQRVDFGRDELHTEEIGLWVGSAFAEITGNFMNCDDLYAYLAANNGNWPTYTTQVGSGICENASWILDCGVAPCSRPPVLASSAHVSFDVSGTSLVAWIVKFSSPQIPFHQMGASDRVIYLLDASFIRPNGTRQRNIRTIDDNGDGSGGNWHPGWGPSVLYSPSGQSFTGVALISTAATPMQLDFNGDGRLSILDRWAQEAVLPGTTLTMNLLLDVDGNGQYDSVDQSLWPDFWTSMQNTGILACSPVDIVDTAENPGGDGMVDSSDYNSFNNAYFAQGAIADIANSAGDISRAFGGPSNGGPDGNIDEGDYNAFWNYFFLDCLR